jgi:hypothetical protein
LRTTLDRSGWLRTSSDRSRVRVIRVDAATGVRQEWLVDCTGTYEAPGLWLRDGDRIEVPDKADSAQAPPVSGDLYHGDDNVVVETTPPDATGVARVLGEVKRPGTVLLKPGERKDIIDAIAECGGLGELARRQIEFTRDGQTTKYTLDELKAATIPDKKIWLRPGDTIEAKRNNF